MKTYCGTTAIQQSEFVHTYTAPVFPIPDLSLLSTAVCSCAALVCTYALPHIALVSPVTTVAQQCDLWPVACGPGPQPWLHTVVYLMFLAYVVYAPYYSVVPLRLIQPEPHRPYLP